MKLDQRAAPSPADPRMAVSARPCAHLAEHIHQVPVQVIPCLEGRTEQAPVVEQASRWASIFPQRGASCWPPAPTGSGEVIVDRNRRVEDACDRSASRA
jgi:hypothetical protein